MSRISLVALLLTLGACQTATFVPDGNPPPPPETLGSTSLDGGIALTWSDESYQWDPGSFRLYRVWSTFYDLDENLCTGPWSVEGTTVAPEFVVGALENGRPMCFRITAESNGGAEGEPSAARYDTPRFESSAQVVFARQADDTRSGFRFWHDLDSDYRAVRGELAWVEPGSGSVDFAVERDLDGALYLVPVRLGVRIGVWGNEPINSINQIDIAPEGGYSTAAIEALPGWGYVVEMDGPDGFRRYGALRINHTGANHVVFEWSFQDDPGNPELIRTQ